MSTTTTTDRAKSLGKFNGHVTASTISTGSIGIDRALGVGGLPRGRFVEVFGDAGSGKTTFALHAIAAAQRAGGTCAFIDVEHALHLPSARGVGVDVDALLVARPVDGEEAIEIVRGLVRSNQVDLIVVDSVAALVSRSELARNVCIGPATRLSRLMSDALRLLAPAVARSRASLVFLDRLAAARTSGDALRYAASVRIELRAVEAIQSSEHIVGQRTRVRVVKNKLAAPFRSAMVDVIFGKGISRASEIVDLGLEAGILVRCAGWYSHDGELLAQGRDATIRRLVAEPVRARAIAAALRAIHAPRVVARPLAVAPAAPTASATATVAPSATVAA